MSKIDERQENEKKNNKKLSEHWMLRKSKCHTHNDDNINGLPNFFFALSLSNFRKTYFVFRCSESFHRHNKSWVGQFFFFFCEQSKSILFVCVIVIFHVLLLFDHYEASTETILYNDEHKKNVCLISSQWSMDVQVKKKKSQQQ